jgi:hypothetical protein
VITAIGKGATRTVDSVEAIEPLLVAFVRGTARWIDPWFPQRGRRGPPTIVDNVPQSEELDFEGRGVRLIREDGALRIVAVGLVDATLELRWSFAASGGEVRGTSVDLVVTGLHHEQCVADFECWFGDQAN